MIKLLFRLRDWPLLLVCLGSITLCVVVFIKGQAENIILARAITATVGGLFAFALVIFYAWRWSFVKHVNYVTLHGIRVIGSHVPGALVEEWTGETARKLAISSVGKEGWKATYLMGKAYGIFAEFRQEHRLTAKWLDAQGNILTRFVRGYALGNLIVIGGPASWSDPQLAWNYVRSLFRHELAHPILYRIDSKYFNENAAHARMGEAGL